KAYHVATNLDEMDWFRRYFNDAADVIDQHYGKGYFGLRLEWGFVERDGEEVKALRVREWPGGKWPWLLDYLEMNNQTLTRKPPSPLSDDERALRTAARDKINRAAARWKEDHRTPGEPVPFLISGDKKVNPRPHAPPEPSLESYGPEDWKFMSDFLIMLR